MVRVIEGKIIERIGQKTKITSSLPDARVIEGSSYRG